MLCKNCNLKILCKTYESVINSSYATIDVQQCDYYNNNGIQQQSIQQNTNKATNYLGKPRPDLKAIEKKVLNIKDKPIPKKITCPTCKGLTYEDDLKICIKCGKTVCSNCSTTDEGKIYCEECWKKL